MTIETIRERQKLRRKVRGIAAALLPYLPNGEIAVEGVSDYICRAG